MGDLTGRDFLSTLDFSTAQVRGLVDLALQLKRGERTASFAGQVAALMFFNPSVRTRVSCEAALARGGGTAIAIHPGADTWNFEIGDGVVMDGGTQEHVRELAPVLSRMCDFIGVRKSEMITSGSTSAEVSGSYDELARDTFIHELAAHAEVPVINLESNRFHPMQGLADMATLVERLERPERERFVLTWAWHPKSLPAATPHSQLLAACDLGMEVTVLRPEGYDLEPAVLEAARARAESLGGSLTTTDDQAAAYEGARVVCAKSWGALGSYGHFEEEARAKQALRSEWIVDEQKLAATNEGLFMHCLPVRRNVIVTDGVLDSARSVVVDEAENRLWTAAAVFAALGEG